MPDHSVYVILRQQEGLKIDDTTIGNLIYEKLTPGIKTVETSDTTTGESKELNYVPQMLCVTITTFSQMVYWKVAKPITPQITITITPSASFNEAEIPTIVEAIYEYANNLQLSEAISADNIFIEALQADPMFKSQRTYTLGSSNVTVASHTNTDTYYDYDSYSFEKSGSNYVISIPAKS